MDNKRLGRPKNKIRSKRVSITGNVSPVFDSDVLEWVDSLPQKMKFPIVINILKIVIDLVFLNSGKDTADIKDFIENNKRTLTIPKMKRRIVALKLRWEIFERDKFRCVVCGRGAEDNVKLQVDHVYPYSKGGLSTKSNLRTLCFECNSGKLDKVSERVT